MSSPAATDTDKQVTTPRKLIILGAALILLILTTVLVLRFIGPSEEDLVRTATTELEGMKTHEQSIVNGVVESVNNNYELARYGISRDRFSDLWLSDFDYSVEEVTVEGNWAVVVATLHVKPLRPLLDAWQAYSDAYKDSPQGKTASEAESVQKQGVLLEEAIRATPISSMSIELQYTVQNNEWRPGDGYAAMIASALVGLG